MAAVRLYAENLPAIVFAMASLEHLITYGNRMFTLNAGLEVNDRAPCRAPTGTGLARRWAEVLALPAGYA